MEKQDRLPPVTCLLTKEDKRHGQNGIPNTPTVGGPDRQIRKERKELQIKKQGVVKIESKIGL